MPRIFILSGPDAGKSVEVGDGATFGRTAECTVYLRDRSVSRQHARLERSEGSWRIVDTQSRNGVTVRGRRVASAAIEDGDELQVGEVLLRFRLEPAAEPAVELEEIVLEPATEPILERTRVSPPPFPPPSPPPPAPRAAPAGRPAAAPAGGTVQRGQHVLQYKKIQDREGFFASDLAQQPLWIKAGAGLLALAVFAALALFAFKGTSLLKSRAEPAPEVDEPAR